MLTYTQDEIINLTGIPKNKAVETCRLLCSEGYLIYDETSGKYSLTQDKEKLEHIEEVKKSLSTDKTAGELYSKIQDIMTFGKPLALSEIEMGKLIDIGIPGLNTIFGEYSQQEESLSDGGSLSRTSGLPRGHCILVKGAPGTGKTTLGMQIAIHLQESRSLYLTLEEDIDQMCKNLEVYCKKKEEETIGWELSDIKKVTRSITKIQIPSSWKDPEIVLQELVSMLDKELPQLVVIDSISRIRNIGGESDARFVLRRLIRTLKIRKITSILLGEDDGDRNAFEGYEVDGIIHLRWEGDQLTLSIDKMRGMKTYKGPHSAAMLTVDNLIHKPEHKFITEDKYKGEDIKKPITFYLRPGFNVFPEISIYNDISKSGNIEEKVIHTGTTGLDKLLKFKIKTTEAEGFKKGEAILIIGSAGAGKTLLGLNFMSKGYDDNKLEEKKKIGVWISLEGDIGTLNSATAGFEYPHKPDYHELLKDKSYFKFFTFPPLNLDLNKIIYTIESLLGGCEIDRLVIDSITELERAKSGGQPEVKTFLAGLIQYLRSRGITTVFISRSDTFFRSIDKIEEQVSSLVDLIISIRNFDMHNQIHKGLYIQKARGRSHNSKIMRMNIDSKKGIEIEDRGWDVENLLAGDTSNIQGPKVFFKLFYENPAEREINDAIIKDFGGNRYPGQTGPTFGAVKKTSIYTEFWSFKGQYSSGHANTRVLSIPDYVISAFRDKKRLEEIDKYMKTDVLQKFKNEETLLNRYEKKEDKKEGEKNSEDELSLSEYKWDSVPCYLDYGVMVVNNLKLLKKNSKDMFSEFGNFLNSATEDINKSMKNLELVQAHKYNWDRLLIEIKKINENFKYSNSEIIPFAFPPLDKESEFVAFFMELLWSFGGDIFTTDIKIKKDIQTVEKAFESKIEAFIFKEFKKFNNVEIEDIECIDTTFKKYFKLGLEQKEKDYIDGFMKWLNGHEISSSNSVLKLGEKDKPFKETIKLMLKLVYWAGVKNPIDGEYRPQAILSRNWHSQISHLKTEKCITCLALNTKDCENLTDPEKGKCMRTYFRNLIKEGKYTLLPLPLAKIKYDDKGSEIYRSVTCLTYWSLVMLKNALSPEIAGNFIESMYAPEYYELRLRSKAGMPVPYMEIKKEKYRSYDPESYDILDSIFDNDKKKGEIIKKFLALDAKKWEEQKSEWKTQIKKWEQKEKELEAKKKELKAQKKEEEEKIKKLEEEIRKLEMEFPGIAFIDAEEFNEMTQDLNENLKRELDKKLNHRAFFSRVRQSRTAFYQLEEALHYQLKQLFLDKEFRDKNIYSDDTIDQTIEIIKSGKDDEKKLGKCLDRIAEEFRTHIIFELLVYFYNKSEDKK